MRRDELYLADILEACDDIAEFVRGLEQETFVANKLVRSAVLQRLTVIGEAAGRVSDELKATHEEIEWGPIAAFRNRLVHGYFSVEWPIVWEAATQEVPALREQIVLILNEPDEEAPTSIG